MSNDAEHDVWETHEDMEDVLRQILDDVESVDKAGDLQLFYERMVANAEDIRSVL